MYTRLLLIILMVLPVLAEAQSPAIRQFYRQHKRDQGMVNATLPAWLVKLGVGIARPFVEDEEARIALRLARKVGKTKFMVAEDECYVSQGQYMKLLADVKKDGFEPLIEVRDEGENVSILSKEKKGMLRNLLILVRAEDSFVLLSLKTRIKADDLAKMINDILNMKKEEQQEGKTDEKPRA